MELEEYAELMEYAMAYRKIPDTRTAEEMAHMLCMILDKERGEK